MCLSLSLSLACSENWVHSDDKHSVGGWYGSGTDSEGTGRNYCPPAGRYPSDCLHSWCHCHWSAIIIIPSPLSVKTVANMVSSFLFCFTFYASLQQIFPISSPFSPPLLLSTLCNLIRPCTIEYDYFYAHNINIIIIITFRWGRLLWILRADLHVQLGPNGADFQHPPGGGPRYRADGAVCCHCNEHSWWGHHQSRQSHSQHPRQRWFVRGSFCDIYTHWSHTQNTCGRFRHPNKRQ